MVVYIYSYLSGGMDNGTLSSPCGTDPFSAVDCFLTNLHILELGVKSD